MHDGQSRREQEVGALQRREVVCTRWWICVMDQEGVGGRTMVDYEWRSESVCMRQWRCVMVRPGGWSTQRREAVCTREWRCVMAGVGKCRMLEQSGEVHMDAP
jgi:hypothetical protein